MIFLPTKGNSKFLPIGDFYGLHLQISVYHFQAGTISSDILIFTIQYPGNQPYKMRYFIVCNVRSLVGLLSEIRPIPPETDEILSHLDQQTWMLSAS